MAENVAELEMRPADLKRSERVDPAPRTRRIEEDRHD
jgi:hypothetical protein